MSFLDPILNPLLSLPSFWAIALISFIVSLTVTLVYKYTTNQELMKDLKAEIKEFQTQLKELKDTPEQFMKVQQEAMKTNMKYMSHSLKSTLYTIIPLFLIFGWMSGHFAFDPINPGQEFRVTATFSEQVEGTVSLIAPAGLDVVGASQKQINGQDVFWTLSGEEGSHTFEIDYQGYIHDATVLITTGNEYLNPLTKSKTHGSPLDTITVDLQKNVIIPLFGWQIGWLISYILFSILFSITLRKMLKVY